MQLKDYFLDKVHFEAIPAVDFENRDEDVVALSVDVGRNKDNNKEFFLALNIKINADRESKKKWLYRCEMSIFGLFDVANGIQEADALKMIGPLGITNLYGIARGVLGQLSGLSPYNKIVLPTINVYEHLSKNDGVKTARKGTKKSSKKNRTAKASVND
ncbi:MAG: protein-export chaperone SecB [Nitrospiraceae bacterium]|nr:protein-export chaperone SecB [Nitrospiraceae bacterium]